MVEEVKKISPTPVVIYQKITQDFVIDPGQGFAKIDVRSVPDECVANEFVKTNDLQKINLENS